VVAFVSLLEKGLPFDIEALDLSANANQEPACASTSITRRIPTLVHPERLADYAAQQWRRPTVQRWINQTRPRFVEY